MAATTLLQADEAQIVHPQQRADEGVAGADDECQQGADSLVVLEDDLNATLLNDSSNDLVPQVAGDGHV